MALFASLLALAVTLAAALRAHARAPEWLVALVALGILLLSGVLGAGAAGHAIGRLAPTVGFLAALLVIAEGCRREGLFAAAGAAVQRRARGSAIHLLAGVFVLATTITIVLGLDATIVLLTPVVLTSTARLRDGARPYLYACTHLANSASLLLPVSNLTNLLAFRASGLSFARFGALMLLPTVVAVAVEWVVLRRSFAADLARPLERSEPSAAPPLPRFPLLVVGATLVGFGLSSLISLDPAWVALAGAVAITTPALLRGNTDPRRVLVSLQPGFLAFVLALGAIVAACAQHGLSSAAHDVLPTGGSLLDLLAIAGVSAVLANAVNNLPATLILLPIAAAAGAGPLLAMLIGVGVGPNLTPPGSLATLLWRRVLREHGLRADLGEFLRLGALTALPAMAGATAMLWLALKL
jgi:arsenical pump membrane protein